MLNFSYKGLTADVATSNIMLMKKDNNQMMMGSTATNSCTNNTTHYCSVNDAHLNPQGVGEHHKNRKQTIENNVSRDENTVHSFCGPSSSATNSSSISTEHQSNLNSTSSIIPCHQQQEQELSTKIESNYAGVKESERVGQLNVESNDHSNHHHHHPNCCLNLRESCVDSPCVSIQQQSNVNHNVTNNVEGETSCLQKDIETGDCNSEVIGSTNSSSASSAATVVTIGLDGKTGFNVHSKKLFNDERDIQKSFASTELKTFKTGKKDLV